MAFFIIFPQQGSSAYSRFSRWHADKGNGKKDNTHMAFKCVKKTFATNKQGPQIDAKLRPRLLDLICRFALGTCRLNI
jgi:hypothetical protein